MASEDVERKIRSGQRGGGENALWKGAGISAALVGCHTRERDMIGDVCASGAKSTLERGGDLEIRTIGEVGSADCSGIGSTCWSW